MSLPEDRYDTLGGYLFGRLSRIGLPGDVIPVGGGEFRVTRMRGRRIEYAVFRPAGEGPDEEDR